MFGLAEREIEGRVHQPPLIDRLLADGAGEIAIPPDVPDVRDYVARALRGGFPEVVLMGSERARQRYLASYIDQLVSRDLASLGSKRDPVRLRRYLQAVAANTAGIPAAKTLVDAAGIDRYTGTAYDALLDSLLITAQLPAWSVGHLNRLIRQPKRYLIDPAFVGPLLGIDARAVMRDGDLLGRVLDTFVVAQLRADSAVSDLSPRLFHARDVNGRHEVDVLAELPDGRVIGIEVKASASPGPADARHLRWLAAGIGNRFALGIVFHTGPRPVQLDDAIWAVPICALWG
jgi:predicted AAA+ superfamily ATPase